MADCIADFDLTQLADAAHDEIAELLERGTIVRFPRAPIELPDEADQRFLRERVQSLTTRKNASWHPEAGRVLGIRGTPDEVARVTAILRGHAQRVEAFLRSVAPELTAGWTVGTTSVRAVEERGRNLRPHASNELVHVDAGAYGATHGARILRFFVNLNPVFDRVWATRGTFAEIVDRWGERAGVRPPLDLAPGPLDRLRGALVRAACTSGLPLARSLDSSPYDRAMRRLHDFMKDDPAFRAGRDGWQEMRFPPGSAWAVMTDGVSHACVSGCHALVSTFLVPLANARRPALAPLAVLSGVNGGARSSTGRPGG